MARSKNLVTAEPTKQQKLEAQPQMFLQTLARRFPMLTQTERRVCELLAMHLRTKEIAVQMGVGERTVETHRQNIRRKLRVPKGKELSAFLCTIKTVKKFNKGGKYEKHSKNSAYCNDVCALPFEGTYD